MFKCGKNEFKKTKGACSSPISMVQTFTLYILNVSTVNTGPDFHSGCDEFTLWYKLHSADDNHHLDLKRLAVVLVAVTCQHYKTLLITNDNNKLECLSHCKFSAWSNLLSIVGSLDLRASLGILGNIRLG